jgi:hypothetical protein
LGEEAMNTFKQSPDDPWVDQPLFEHELTNTYGEPDTRGLCDTCGDITENPNSRKCFGCDDYEGSL